LDNIKSTKKKKEDQWYSNKKSNDNDYQYKVNKLLKKFKKSKEIVQENQQKFKHQMDLQNEKRRLREYDLMMERDRMKQLSQVKKEQIINKEKKDEKLIKSRQIKQTILREQLMNNRINDLIKKDIFTETIQNVVHDNTNQKMRNKLLKKNNINLAVKTIPTLE